MCLQRGQWDDEVCGRSTRCAAGSAPDQVVELSIFAGGRSSARASCFQGELVVTGPGKELAEIDF